MADQDLRDFYQGVTRWVKAFPSNVPRYFTERLPIVKWLPRYSPKWLVRDAVAGLTVGLIVVPQGMSYSKVANLPPANGLYSAYIGAFFYCFMGTSKDLTIGPTAVISLITGHLVTELAGRLTPVEVAAVSCILVGAISFLMGFLRLGIILDFFPTAVLVGYTSGAAATIVVSQIPKLLGISTVNNRDPSLTVIINICKALGTVAWRDLVFGLVSWVILILIGLAVDRWGRQRFSIQLIKISRFFIVTVIATIASYIVNLNPALDAKGNPIYVLSILKTVPKGLPDPIVPPVESDLLGEIAGSIFSIALATILEHIAIAKAFARRNRYQLDTNQELLALGLANITASFFGAYTVTGSFSRSAVKVQCGVKSPLAGFVTGILVLFALFFLTPAFFWIPDAALSAVIIVAVSTLISPPSVFIQFFKVNIWDFLISILTMLITFFISVEVGIPTGVGCSVAVLLYRVARPQLRVLQQIKERKDVFVDTAIGTFETVPAPHGILVFRIEESAVFPNTEYFINWVTDEVYKQTRFSGLKKSAEDRLWSDDLDVHIANLRKIAHGADTNVTDDDLPSLRAIILDFSGVNNIDSSGLQGLFELRQTLRLYAGQEDDASKFFEIHFVNIQANVLRLLELSGITRPVAPIALQKVEVIDNETVAGEGEGIEPARHVPTDLGSGAISVIGSNGPFLKESGLVHLTVRDAVDAVEIRAQAWETENHNVERDADSVDSTKKNRDNKYDISHV